MPLHSTKQAELAIGCEFACEIGHAKDEEINERDGGSTEQSDAVPE